MSRRPDLQKSDTISATMANGENSDVIGFIASTVETIRDQMATKDELANAVARLDGRIDSLSEKLDASTTIITGNFEQIHFRLDTVEHSISSRFEYVEGELSRLRSAVYLLGKDQPDVLRLLGRREN
jgi:hypothetical protein